MEKIPDNNRKYLSDLKEETRMSWADLSAATKLPDSTIRKIFSGETADPRLETISLIVSAMGGSIDTMLSGKSAKEKTPHRGIPHEETSDGFDEVRSAYEKRLAEMQESYERYIESLKKDKSVLFAIACVLTALGQSVPQDAQAQLDALTSLGAPLPRALDGVLQRPVRFSDVIDPQDMMAYVQGKAASK